VIQSRRGHCAGPDHFSVRPVTKARDVPGVPVLRWEPIEADAWVVKRTLVVALVIPLLTGCGSSRATHRTVRYAPTRRYKVTTTDPRGDTFSITRDPDGSIIRTCHPAGIPGCSSAGTW